MELDEFARGRLIVGRGCCSIRIVELLGVGTGDGDGEEAAVDDGVKDRPLPEHDSKLGSGGSEGKSRYEDENALELLAERLRGPGDGSL